MKLSGPQKNFFTPAESVAGTRAMAFSTKGPMRAQSGSISPKEKPSGTRGTFHAAAAGSNRPTCSEGRGTGGGHVTPASHVKATGQDQ